MTLKQCYQNWMRGLKSIYSKEESRSLLIKVLSVRFNWQASELVTQQHTELSDLDLNWLNQVLSRLMANEPIQYILGRVWFCGHEFKASKYALIPRPETEELVRLIVEMERQTGSKKALDIGTGSGCIALSLAASMNNIYLQAWDISDKAVALARENQKKIGVMVQWRVQDIFQPWPKEWFDFIVSNPPYIPMSEKSLIHNNVLQYEPHMALFVSDEDPLNYYRRISDQARHYLNPGGRLYFECHYRYAGEVHQMLQQMGYTEVVTCKDQWSKQRFVWGIQSEK